MGPGSPEVTDVMGGLLFKVEKNVRLLLNLVDKRIHPAERRMSSSPSEGLDAIREKQSDPRLVYSHTTQTHSSREAANLRQAV